MISARFSLNNPDKMEATLSLTMTVGDMRAVIAKIKELESIGHETGHVLQALQEVVYAAHQNFVKHAEDDK